MSLSSRTDRRRAMVSHDPDQYIGQVPGIDVAGVRRRPSNPTPTISRKSSTADSLHARDSGLNKRAITPVMGRDFKLASAPPSRQRRGKLPWLDGNQQSAEAGGLKKLHVPGSFSSELSLPLPDNTPATSAPMVASATEEKPAVTAATKRIILKSDPSLRPVGSTPSLRRTPRTPGPRKLSLGSTYRRPIPLKSTPLKPTPVSRDGIVGLKRDGVSSESSDMPSISEHGNQLDASEKEHPLRDVLAPKSEHLERTSTEILKSTQGLLDHLDLPPAKPAERQSKFLESVQDTHHPKGEPGPQYGDVLMSSTHTNTNTISHKPVLRVTPARNARPSISNVSPTTQIPMASPSPRTDVRSLRRAVTGLENLMEEALAVARDAAAQNRTSDVASILDEATVALRRASTVRGRMAEPLTLSESDMESLYSTSDSDVSSVSSCMQRSVDTLPTAYTKSAQSSHEPIRLPAQGTEAHLKRVSSDKVDTLRPGDYFPSESDGESISKTPPRLYHPKSADSIVIDWAY
ncbi:hypothetical protein LTR28_007858, partial [Elasticomyces elasticus]